MNEVNMISLESQRDWLEYFYKELYLQVGFGPRQNVYYMQEIISHLDKRIIDYIDQGEATILDMGCAMGFGTIKLLDRFPQAKIFGLDVCRSAVEGGQARFPNINFIHHPDGIIENYYEIIISSHCLEHYIDPEDILLDMLRKTIKYCIVMVPYNEYPLLNKHLATITEDTFPEKIIIDENKYLKISSVIFNGDRQYCRNDMIQVVYERW